MLTKDKILEMSLEVISKTDLYSYLPEDKIYTIYAAGSLLEGFGNSKSDIDLFVVANNIDVDYLCREYPRANQNMTCLKRANVSVFNINYLGTDLDIEVYEESYLSEYIRQLNEGIATSHDSRFDLFHRLKFAVPLFKDDNFWELKSKINYELFNFLPAKSLSLYYPVKSKDIQGAYEEKAYETSFYMALRLLEDCISAYLAMQGETNPNTKWLMKKINRYEKHTQSNLNIKAIHNMAYSNIDLNDPAALKMKTLNIMKECQKFNTQIEKNRKEVFLK